MLNKDYILYTHLDSEITTISEFLNSGGQNTEAIVRDYSQKEFLAYEAESIKNIDRIYEKYTEREKESEKSKYKSNNLTLIKYNTVVAIPKDKLFREIVSITGQNQLVEYANFNTFLGEYLDKLMKDPEYKPATKYTLSTYFNISKNFPIISVWIWVRSLNIILDISEFVGELKTSVGASGGNFQIDLAAVTLDSVLNSPSGYVSKELIYKINQSDKFKKTKYFLHSLVSVNDLVFIRFEKLNIEKERKVTQPFQTISPQEIPNHIYDMIGLVDVNTISSSFDNNNVIINLSGRDLIKLIIEDGSYFNVLTLSDSRFLNVNNENIQNRLVTTSKYEILLVKSFRSIRSTIQFLINQLSNMGVVPNQLFASYGNDRSMVFRMDNEKDYVEKEMKGIWQIIKILIDENVQSRRIIDDSLSAPDGSFFNQFLKVCQEPFVEFFCDTYGKFYNFIIRRPPFDLASVLEFLNKTNSEGKPIIIDIEPEDVFNETFSYNDDNIFSWYEIIPQGNISGVGVKTVSSTIPAIYFPQYGEIWGNRKLSIVTNYIPYVPLTGDTKETNTNYFVQQILDDYKFVIDTHFYLPFTRNGSIMMIGDRRIKKGTFIRYKPTGEIFYVDSVTQNFSISESSVDRVTSLQLSRGMVEDYIKGKSIVIDGELVNVSYANILNTELVKEYILKKLRFEEAESTKIGIQIKKNFGVNEKVFKFFLERLETDINEREVFLRY